VALDSLDANALIDVAWDRVAAYIIIRHSVIQAYTFCSVRRLFASQQYRDKRDVESSKNVHTTDKDTARYHRKYTVNFLA